MYGIRSKSDKVVQYLFDSEPVFKDCLIKPVKALDINLETHEVFQAQSGPEYFQGGYFTFDGEWALTAEGQAAKALRDAEFLQSVYRNLESAVDGHVDSVARAKGYDNRLTATMRAGYENPRQAEGIAFGQWMDSCYLYCQGVQADILAGTRPIPTTSELIAELPAMVWPE